MTTYYISPNGLDANNGLGPDASAATNKPWLTLGKALITGSPVVPGDTVYVAPGYYYASGNYTVLASITSTASPTQIVGDPTNRQGFKDGSGVLLAPGLPWATTRTSGDGLDGPISTANNFFQNTGVDIKGLQFKFLVLETRYDGILWNGSAATSSDILFQDCYLISTGIFNLGLGAPTANRNHIIRRCDILTAGVMSINTATAAATADANLNILVEESFIFGALTSVMAIGASGGNIGGGITFKNLTVLGAEGGTQQIGTTALRVSTVSPINVGGCLFLTRGQVLNAGTTGQIIDTGYNRIITLTNNAVYTLTTQAGTSFIGVAPNLVLPHLVTWGLEMPRADLFGWTDAALTAQKFSASGSTTPDFRGRTARPWGAGSSIGCWQVPDVVQDASSAITGGGTNSLKLTGAGEVSFYVPVDAISTTISVRSKSTTYGGTNWPQLIVVANGTLGIASDLTVTATSATEAVITSPTFTPTAKGVVEIRLVSRSTTVTSSTWWDLLTSP